MNRARILVVDDDAHGAESLSALLRARGCAVEWAANGESALAKLPLMAPDLLVVDEYMPGITGLEVVGRLREQAEFRGLPVLLLTAADDAAFAALRERLGALHPAAALQKPADLGRILLMGQSLLDEARAAGG
jgi:CheY-like chemotaxis protein